MSRFDPAYYLRYRPAYPTELFGGLFREARARGFAEPFAMADIGCGTGHSALSLARAGALAGFGARILGVDPDPRMLEQARVLAEREGFAESVEWSEGKGEASGLGDRSVDAILVGSALHWMDPWGSRDEFLRLLRPRGLVLAFEYQFPKAPAHAGLNEWIRREFNLRWKAPDQRPRGDFDHVTRGLREDPRLALLERRRSVPMAQVLGPEDLQGLLLSQSRVLHYEETLGPGRLDEFRSRLLSELRDRMPAAGARFDFALTSSLFGRVDGE